MQFVNSFNAKLFHVALESLVSTKLTKFYYCIKLINERQLLVKRSHMSHVSRFCGYLCEIEILAKYTFNESPFEFHFFNRFFNIHRNFRIITILFPHFLFSSGWEEDKLYFVDKISRGDKI